MAQWDWLAATAGRDEDLSIAYTIDGEPLPRERTLDHLPGHRGSAPVRVGNDAGRQRQHDVYGSVMEAAAYCFKNMDDMDRAMPEPVLARIADLAARRWHLPDDSIWETRAGRARQRDAAGAAILQQCWNRDLAAFTATAGGDQLDAATLAIPLHGLLPVSDPRCRTTRQAVTDQLIEGGLLHRYHYDDGLGQTDNPFLLCTLWLADNHSLDGDPDHAEQLMGRVLATSNDLGLLAEEADPDSNDPVGNFPQGLTHLGVIATACRIDDARKERP